MEYYKTPVAAPFSVRSVISAHYIEMSGKRFGGEWHDFPELFYVRRGTHRVIVDGELFVVNAGQAIIYAPHAYHCGRSDLPASEAVVEIICFETDLAELPELCNRVLTPDPATCEMIERAVTLGCACFEKLPKGSPYIGMRLREGVSEADLHRLKNLLELVLMDLYGVRERTSSTNRKNQKLEQLAAVRAFLREHLNASFTQEEIAAHCHLSVSKLKALCHEQLGCGPISYFIALKIGEAKRLIADSSMNFTEIAEHLGFASIHYFSKLFKEKTGLTPSEYARSLK